jgi:hypothetical protein
VNKVLGVLNKIEAQQQEPTIPKDVGAKQLLQMVYRGEIKLSQQQMRAAIEVLAFEEPKLTAVAHASLTGQDFAAMLDRALKRSMAGMPPSASPSPKVIEHQAIENEGQTEE